MSEDSGKTIDLKTWKSTDQFHFFRTYERPHYAVTSRIDVSKLMTLRAELGVFRTCIWAIGAGLHAVPEMRMRFRGDVVTEYERLDLSPTIATDGGDFRYTYLAWQPDRPKFDAYAAEQIAKVRAGAPLNANSGARHAVAYLSCMPWLDYTSLDNALPDADDCIPRVSWGKIVPKNNGFDMAVTMQSHHALVQGLQVAQFFEATQAAFDDLIN